MNLCHYSGHIPIQAKTDDIRYFEEKAECLGLNKVNPYVEGKEPDEQRPLFWQYSHYGNQGDTPGFSIRLGNYKLIELFEDSSLELYDMYQDMSELHNLAEEFPEVTAKLHGLLAA